MEMWNSFAGIWSAVENEAEAALGQAKLFRDFGGFEQQEPQHLLIFGSRFRDAGDGPFGDDQNVNRRLRLDVAKREHRFVFVNNRGRNFARSFIAPPT